MWAVRSLFAVAALALLVPACSGAQSAPDRAARPSPDEAARSGEASPDRNAATPSPLVDPAEILAGGPPPDGIPPIDQPRFADVADVEFLADEEPVLAVEIRGDTRAYPLQILTWHEIVNDTVGGVPVAVTYCPLCNTGIVFERPTIKGELLDLGTSGKLYNSNLVMYDRQTGSYWAQATGQAIVGELTGRQLRFVPARIVSFGDWRVGHPTGLVLSRNTGFDRPYGENPYAGYDRSSQPFLFSGRVDPRLDATERVLGIARANDVVAFPYASVRSNATGGWAVVMEDVAGGPIAVFWKAGTTSALDAERIAAGRDVGAIAAYRPKVDGLALTFEATPRGIVDEQTGSTWNILGRAVSGSLRGEELLPELAIDSFWFDWAAFHPDTRIYGER